MFRRILAVALLLCLVFQPLISQADELGKHILNSILAKKKPSDASLLLLSRDLGWYFDNMEFLPAEYRDRIQDLRVEVAGRSAQDAAAKLGEPEAIFGATGSWKPGRDMDMVYFGKNIRKARLQVNASFEEITADILSRHGPGDEILRSAAGIAIPDRLSTGTMSLVVSDVPDFGYKDLERAYLGAKEAFERGESREMVMKRLRDHFWEGLGKNYEAHMASTAPDMYRGAGGQEWWSANYLENPQKMQTFVRDPATGKWSLKEGGLKAVPEEILERVGFGAFKGRGGAKFSKIASDYAMFFKHEEGGLSATAKYVYRIWDDVDGQVIAKAVAREDVKFFLVANRIAQDPQNAAKYLADFNMTEGPLKKGLSDMLYRWTEKQLLVDTEKLVNELAYHLLSAPASNLDDLIADLVAKARLKFDLHDMASGLDVLRQAPNDAQKKLIKALEARFGESKAGQLTIKYIKKQLRLLADEGGELTLRILKMLKDMGRIQDDPYQRAVKSFEETGQLTDDLADTVIMARKEVMLISSAGMFDVVDDPQALDRLMEEWRKFHSGAIIQSPNRELAAFRTEFRELPDSELKRLGWTVDELRIPVGIKQKLPGGPALLMKLEGKLGGKLAKSGVTIRQFQSKLHEILFNPAYTQLGDSSASVGALDAFIGVAVGLYTTYQILFDENQKLTLEEENLQLGNAWVTALPIVGDFAQGLITGSQGWYEGDYEKVLEAGLWISIGVMGCVPGGQLPAVILGISLATKPLVVSAYNAGQAQNLVRAWVESGDWAMEEKPHKLKGLFDRGEKLHAITYEDLLTEKGNKPYKSKMADSPSAAAVVADGLSGIDVTMNGSIRAYAEQYVIPQFTAIRSMRAGLKNLYPDFNDQDWTDELTAKKKIVDRGGKGGLPLFGAYYRLRTKALEQTLAQLKSWAEDEKRAEKDYDAEVARLKGELQKLQDELKCPTLIAHADESVEAYSRVIKNVWEQESLSLSKLRIYEHYVKTYKTIAGKLRRVSDLFRECSVPYVPPSWHLMGFPEFDVDRVNTLLSSMENGRKGVIENIEKLLKEFDQPVTKYDPANECHKKAFDVLAPLRYKVAFNENLILYYKQLADSDSTWSSAYDAAKQRYTQQRDSLMKQAGKSARDLVESAAFLDAFMTYVASISYGLASKDAELYRSTSRDYEVRLSGAQKDHVMAQGKNGLAGEALRGCLLAAIRLELVLSETEPEEGQDIKASVRLTGGTPPKENHWDWKTSGGLRASSRAGQEITVNAASEGVVTVRLLDHIDREAAKVLATASAPVKPKKKDGKKDEKKPEDKKPEDKKPEDKKIGLVPPVIQTCSYQYSEWGECSRETKKQTRTVTGREPQGCVEKVKPILEQACTPPTAAIKITVPAEVLETDIFKASAQVSPDIAGRASKYIWGGGAELINPDEKGTRSTKTPQATLQFQPMTGKRGELFDPNQKIYLDVYDGAGKLMGKGEIPIKLKPVGFSASAAWEVTPVVDGFNLKRKEAIKKAPCGDQSCEAVVRGTLQLRWTGGSLGSYSSVPKNMEDLKKEVPRLHVGKMQGTYHAVTPGKDEEFAIGDFKGLVAHKPPQLYYQGSEYVDLVFPGTLSWVTGYLLKGNSRIFINGDVSGGGSRKGEGGQYWFDDTPFVDQHTKAAHAEMMAILKSIVIGPDNKIKQIPYKGPAFDGSDLPSVKLVYSQKGKLKMGEVVIVKAVVEKAKPEDSPLKFEWSGDHAGQGETVHFMAQKAGKSTLSVAVTGARFPMGSASANFR